MRTKLADQGRYGWLAMYAYRKSGWIGLLELYIYIYKVFGGELYRLGMADWWVEYIVDIDVLDI